MINLIITLVLTGLFSLIVGVILGLLITDLRSTSDTNRKKVPKNLIKLVTLYRDKKSSKMVVGCYEKYFRTVGEFPEKTIITLTQLLDEWRVWLGAADINARLSEITFADRIEVLRKEKTAKDSFMEGTNRQNTLEEIGIEPSLVVANDIINPPVSSLDIEKDKIPKIEEPAKSIAVQIDEIIKEKIPASPFYNRTIRLLEYPERGLVVFVDGKQYESVEDVSEEDVKQFIKQCVSDWEKRMGAL